MQVTFIACCMVLVAVALVYVLTRSKPVYMVDYHCYKPPVRQVFLVSSQLCMSHVPEADCQTHTHNALH